MSLDALLAPHRDALDLRAPALLDLPQPHLPAGTGQPAGADLLRRMVAGQLGTGGKRLRGLLPPALVAAGDGPVEAALDLGAAIELSHNGTLVHDDIQDGDRLRRGLPTLWTVHGTAQAINAGDALLVGPLAGILRSPTVPADLRAPLCGLLAEALFETIRGQVADLALRDLEAPELADLEAVHLAKTGPLFGACFVGAALLLGGSHTATAAARTLGARIGLAFQVRDDLLDLAGTKGRGEPGADLREGKLTWPVLLALRDAPEAEAAALRSLVRRAAAGAEVAPADVAHQVRWVIDRGGLDGARRELARILDEARAAADTAYAAGPARVVHALCDRLALLDG